MRSFLHRAIYCIAFCSLLSALQAQDSTEQKTFADYVDFRGYIKDLQFVSFLPGDSLFNGTILHNRLNWKLYPMKNMRIGFEVRNQLFVGDMVRTAGYADYLDMDPGYVDMHFIPIASNGMILETDIDRLYAEYSFYKFRLRVGRQRINWGKTLVWNPNDLFNALNFADFDYAERPGSDAVRLEYASGMQRAEIAVKPGKTKDEMVAAALYTFNVHTYDIQFLGGWYYTDYAIGTGWAGNLKEAGFKGEVTYFTPRDTERATTDAISAVLSLDYSFHKPIYMQGAVLYTSSASENNNPDVLSAFSGDLSARKLMPCTWSVFGQISSSFSPVWQMGVAAMYGADPQLLFIMPNIAYSIKENWDLSLIAQHFSAGSGAHFAALNNSVFLRTMWSF